MRRHSQSALKSREALNVAGLFLIEYEKAMGNFHDREDTEGKRDKGTKIFCASAIQRMGESRDVLLTVTLATQGANSPSSF